MEAPMNPTVEKDKSAPGILIAASVVIILAGAMAAQEIVLILLLSVFISIISAKPVLWLEEKKVPHFLAIILVMSLMIFLFTFLGALIGRSLTNLTASIPAYEDNLRKLSSNAFQQLDNWGFSVTEYDLIHRIDSGKVFQFFANALSELGSFMSDSFLILLIVVFVLLELHSFTLKAKVARDMGGRKIGSLSKMTFSIRQYLWIKTIMSFLTGCIIAIWLAIVGVDYAILWGLIAFLLNYIPNIGSIIAAVPAVLFALVQLGFGGAMWTLAAFFVVNNVVGNMIEPKVTGEGLGLSTLVVFLSLVIWGYIFGTIGMFLSVPLTIVFKIILEENPRTRWMAIILGSEKEAKDALKSMQ